MEIREADFWFSEKLMSFLELKYLQSKPAIKRQRFQIFIKYLISVRIRLHFDLHIDFYCTVIVCQLSHYCVFFISSKKF